MKRLHSSPDYATVDALCIASALTAKGAVTAGVRALVRLAKESQ